MNRKQVIKMNKKLLCNKSAMRTTPLLNETTYAALMRCRIMQMKCDFKGSFDFCLLLWKYFGKKTVINIKKIHSHILRVFQMAVISLFVFHSNFFIGPHVFPLLRILVYLTLLYRVLLFYLYVFDNMEFWFFV